MVSVAVTLSYRRRPRKQQFPQPSPFNCILDRHRFPERNNELYKVVESAKNTDSSKKPNDSSGPSKCGLKKKATSERESSSGERKRSPPADSTELYLDNVGVSSRRSRGFKVGNPAESDQERAGLSNGQERRPRQRSKTNGPVSNKKEELPGTLDGQERRPGLKFKIKAPLPPPLPPPPHPPLPERFMLRIRQLGFEGDPVLVIQKALFASDVSNVLQRLSIPASRVEPAMFLEPEEITMLDDRDLKHSIPSILIDDRLNEREIRFKKWYMNNSGLYVLLSDWNRVVLDNKLREGTRIQVWSFRLNGILHFVLVKLQS